MAISSTPRFVLKKYSSGGDPHPSRAEHNAMIDALENNAAMFSQGPSDARPTAGKRGREYWDETAKRKYYDDGANWQDTNPNGGGGAGKPIDPGAAAVEGTSARAARADHTHRLDMASATVDGAMSAADKAKLDAATSNATGNAIARRDSSGRVSVTTPSTPGHAATKGYVDGQIETLGEQAADYADVAVEEAPNATQTVAGKMSAADKAKLDAATYLPVGDAIARRHSSGAVRVVTGTDDEDAANKGYVDGKVGAATTAANTYANNAVSNAPTATATAAGKMSAADKVKLDAATSSPTGGTLALRHSSGSIQVVTGTAAADAASKGYVDGQIGQTKTYADDAVAAAPLASATVDGKMPKADKIKLDAATANADGSAIVRRDANGRASFTDPTSAAQAATKGYVDTAVSGAKSYADAAVTAAPVATGTTDGKMSAADKSKLDTSTSSATGLAIMQRNAAGQVSVAAPTSGGHAVTKTYADGKLTEAKTYTDDAVAAVTQPSKTYTPTWAGFIALGTGYARGAEYEIIGPETVRVSAYLIAGTGAAMGANRLSVSLPFPAAGYALQYGEGALLETGPNGIARMVKGMIGGGSTSVDLSAWPDQAQGGLVTPGAAGYPFKPGTEIHFSMTYRAVIA